LNFDFSPGLYLAKNQGIDNGVPIFRRLAKNKVAKNRRIKDAFSEICCTYVRQQTLLGMSKDRMEMLYASSK